MTDPVKAIQTVKHRLARLAALQTLTALLPPVMVLAAAGLGLRTLGIHTWERLGLMLSRQSESHLQTGLLATAALGVIASVVLAGLSFRRRNDLLQAAELIDRKLGCREEVLTLATMAGGAGTALRSPLFPVLWRRASEYMDKLNPLRRAFPFRAGPPLRQALFLSVCTLALLITGITVLLAANHPPLGAEARQIRKLAREIANTGADAGTRELADRLHAVADTLEDPKVPPEIKLEQLASAQRELKAQQQRRQQQQGDTGKNEEAAGKGNQGQGSGQGKEGSGQGKEGTGQGQGQGKGSGHGAGSAGNENNGDNQIAEARKDISKVQAQLEAAAAKRNSAQRSDAGGQKGRSPKPGEQPDLASLESATNRPDLGRIKASREHGQEESRSPSPQSGQTRRDFGSSRGDTHLGQFPQPGNFERFYAAGEHGPPLDIKNARYVLFRIPPAMQSGGKGKSVIDNDRTSATVPYENLPLKDERIAAEPDERQLVPPRYRGLLR